MKNMCELVFSISSIVYSCGERCFLSEFSLALGSWWKSASAPLRLFLLRGERAQSSFSSSSSFRQAENGIRSLFHIFSCSSTFNSSGSLKVRIAKRPITCARAIKVILIYDTFVCCRCRAVKAQLKKLLLCGINLATRQGIKGGEKFDSRLQTQKLN